MLSRILMLTVAAVLCAATTAAQSVTFSTTAYPNNNLWSQNGQINGHIRADLNGDGIEDFISQNDGSFSGGCTGSFAVAMSNSNGTYAAPVCYTLPNGDALLFAVGDFYSYGTLDVVVANQYGELYIYQNNGNGSLHLQNDFAIDGVPSGVVAADVNHDGILDLVYDVPTTTGLSTLHVYFGAGSGTFTQGPTSSFNMNGEPAGALSVGDFDNDSHADVSVLGVSQVENEILYGDGAGHFTAGPIVGGRTTQYAAYDPESDGTMDLIGAPFTSNPYGTPTYFNYLDLEQGHHNRTLTSQHIPLKNCTASGAPPVVADFNGDGINDIVIAEASDCKGSAPYTLNVLLGNGDGTYQPEQVLYSSSDFISEWHVLRASHGSKPDLTVFVEQLADNQISNPRQLILVNTTTGNFPACSPSNFRPTGVEICSPTSTVGATSPVTFSFGSENQTPARDMELWVDGKKLSENLKNTYSYYSFLTATVPLSNGVHSVTAYSVGWDYSLLTNSFSLTVGSSTCPPPNYIGLNVCSPLQESTVGSPVLAYASGNAGGPITRMEVWVDGVKEYSTFGSNTIKASIKLASGWHMFTYYLVPVDGPINSESIYAAVP